MINENLQMFLNAKKYKNKFEYYDNETFYIKSISWYKDNELHKDEDEPAKIYLDRTGHVEQMLFYKHGILHRDGDEPAFIILDSGNRENRKRWKHWIYYKNGKIHRDGGLPAEIEEDDEKYTLRYYNMNDNYKNVFIPKVPEKDGNIK